jgi:hypothetical protein
MTTTGGLTFGEPNVDLAVSAAARAYGDDVAQAMASSNPRDRRCLSAAASALNRAGGMKLEAAADAVGVSAQAVRVARTRNAEAFRIAEGRAMEALRGELAEGPFGEASTGARISAGLQRAWSDPAYAQAKREQSRRNRAVGAARRREAVARGNVPERRLSDRVARKLPYLKRFIAAGYTVQETAYLFGLADKTVKRAVARG